LSQYAHPHPPELVATSAKAPPTNAFDDMHDSPDDFRRYPSLPLRPCEDVTKAFDDVDTNALTSQKTHARAARRTAQTGTVAVMLAILALSIHGWLQSHVWLQWVMIALEVALGGYAFGTAMRGQKKGYKEDWLRLRHQAELCRLLKYRFLLRPDVWQDTTEESQRKWIGERLHEIHALQAEKELEEAVRQPSPHGPFQGTQCRLPRKTVRDLMQYYLAKRLSPQKEYLANRALRNEFKDKARIWLYWLFLGSIVAIFLKLPFESVVTILEKGHFESSDSLKEMVTRSTLIAGWLAAFAALLAAWLPAMAAGLRVWLGAFEFSRNRSRFYAAHRALSQVEQSLVGDTLEAVAGAPAAQGSSPIGLRIVREEEDLLTASGIAEVRIRTEETVGAGPGNLDDGRVDASAVLSDLSWCEHILDAEHREWLRLMYDAEWFG